MLYWPDMILKTMFHRAGMDSGKALLIPARLLRVGSLTANPVLARSVDTLPCRFYRDSDQ